MTFLMLDIILCWPFTTNSQWILIEHPESVDGLALEKTGWRVVSFGMLPDKVCVCRTMLESDLKAEEEKGLACYV